VRTSGRAGRAGALPSHRTGSRPRVSTRSPFDRRRPERVLPRGEQRENLLERELFARRLVGLEEALGQTEVDHLHKDVDLDDLTVGAFDERGLRDKRFGPNLFAATHRASEKVR
jgi:hypothetical protein